MADKSLELSSSIRLVNDKLHFMALIGANEPISIDYTPPLGDDLGYTSLELLLLSLSSCMGSSVLKSPDTSEEDFNKVLKLSEETYCPVWAMLKGNVEIEVKSNIVLS